MRTQRAAIISPVGRIAYRGELLVINENRPGEMTRELYDRLTGIQLGELPDTHGWNRLVGAVGDKILLEAADPEAKYAGGGMALFVAEGRLGCDWVEVKESQD